MVTIRELFSSELPDSGCASTVEAFLAAGPAAVAAYASPSFATTIGTSRPPRPFLGPSQEVAPPAELLESHYEAVREARERASEHLRLALCKRAESRASSSKGRDGASMDIGGAMEDVRVPAVFPFPEPIPHEAPPRELSKRSGRGSLRGDSRTVSRMSHRSSAFSPPASRLACERSISAGSPEYVPAVFPFPEPIPREPPERPAPKDPVGFGSRSVELSNIFIRPSSQRAGCRPRSVASSDHSVEAGQAPSKASVAFRGVSEQHGESEIIHARSTSPICDDRQRRRMPRCVPLEDETFVIDENRQRANQWISQCAPKTWMLEQERPVWLQRKLWFQRERKHRDEMFKNMSTMPFDMWLEMKHTLASNAATRRREAYAAKQQQEESNGNTAAKAYARAKADETRALEAELAVAAQREEVEMRCFYKQLAAVRRMEYKLGRDMRMGSIAMNPAMRNAMYSRQTSSMSGST